MGNGEWGMGNGEWRNLEDFIDLGLSWIFTDVWEEGEGLAKVI